MRYKTCISFFLSILLSVQNIAYAVGSGSGLEEPLLASDHQERSAVRIVSSARDIEMKSLGEEDTSSNDQEPALSLPRLSSPLETFLETYNLTSDDIESRGLSLERLQELLRTDTTWLTSFRWMAVDGSVEKVLDYSVLGRGAITHSDDDLKGKWCDQRVWMNGRDMPVLSKSTRQNLLFMEGLRNGVAYVFFRELHLTVLGFLGYDLITSIQNGNLSFDALVSVFGSQETATINYLLGLLQNPAGPYIVTGILGAPLLWGVTKGLCNIYAEKHSTLQNRIKLQEEIKDYPKGKWGDSGRWMLPFHPIDRKLNTLIRDLRFNGEMTSEEVEEIFNTLKQLTTERSGYSQIVGMHHLANLAYGINLKDYAKFVRDPDNITEEERQKLLTYLHLKLESYSIIHDTAEDIFQKWKARENIAQGADIIWKGLYAKYLMWSLGQNNWGWLTMGSLKAAKATLFGFFLKTLIESLITYFQCPETFQHLRYGEIGPISNTIECFNEYVRIFNQIPGQPVETLTELIPHVNFPNNQYRLDLSNHGIGNVTTIIQILDAFRTNGITLTSLDLSGNFAGLGSPASFEQVGMAIGQHPQLQTLLFRNNGMEFFGSSTTIAFTKELENKLSQLEVFDLSQNYIGEIDSRGTIAIGKVLQFFPQLKILNLSNNQIGFTDAQGISAISKGFVYLSNLVNVNLTNNYIGLVNDLEVVSVIGENLPFLKNLLTLDFTLNIMGSQNPIGMKALAQGLSKIPQLENFLFNPQKSGITNEIVDFLNEGLQKTKACCLVSILETEEAIQAYLERLPTNTEQLLLSGRLSPTVSVMNALFQGIKVRFPKLSILDLSSNGIGSENTKGTIIIGEGLCSIPNLTFLNLSSNAIGYTGEEGIISIGENLQCVSQLTVLDLSSNAIGLRNSNGSITLANGLKYTPHLTFLSFGGLYGNYIGSTDDNGVIALGSTLASLQNLIFLDFGSNNIGKTNDTGTLAMGKGLRSLLKLTSMSFGGITGNFIEYTSDLGVVALGSALASLQNLTFLDLSNNNIGSLGTSGTAAIGEGLQNNTVLVTINLAGNPLGERGLQGIEILLNNVVRDGLNLNLGGGAVVPWTTGSQALYKLNEGPIQSACYQQRCFGGDLPQNTTAPQSTGPRKQFSLKEYNKYQKTFSSDFLWHTFSAGQRRTLSAAFGDEVREAIYKGLALEVSELDGDELDSSQSAAVSRSFSQLEETHVEDLSSQSPFFLTRWGRGVGRFFSSSWQFTKEKTQSYWDSMWDWIEDAVTTYAHEVVTENPSYFPNGDNHNVRDWGGPVYFNTTSLHHAGVQALPQGGQIAFP